MAKRTREYFKTLTTYTGSHLAFMDSIMFNANTSDTASTTTSGHAKKVSDANAVLRADDDSDGFTRFLQPHQLPSIITVTTDHLQNGVDIDKNGLTLQLWDYQPAGSILRQSWLLKVKAGSPGGATELNVIGVSDSGTYLKANSSMFERNVGTGVLEIKDGGIAATKLTSFGSVNKVLKSGATGAIEAATATVSQVDALAGLTINTIPYVDASGYLASSAVNYAKISFLDVVAGTRSLSKAIVVDGFGKIDALDITALTLNGTLLSATAKELNRNASVTPGTISANKTVMADANTNLGIIKGTQLWVGATGAETQITASPTELNRNAGVIPGTLAVSKTVMVDGAGKINSWDPAALSIGGTLITSSATELNQLAGQGVLAADFALFNGLAASGVTAADMQAIDNFDGVVSSDGTNLSVASGKRLRLYGSSLNDWTVMVTTNTIQKTNNEIYIDLSAGDITLNLYALSAADIGSVYHITVYDQDSTSAAVAPHNLTLEPNGAQSIIYNSTEAANCTIPGPPIGSRITVIAHDADTWMVSYARPPFVYTGTDNPTATAPPGEPGDMYVKTDTHTIYVKEDTGASANWLILN